MVDMSKFNSSNVVNYTLKYCAAPETTPYSTQDYRLDASCGSAETILVSACHTSFSVRAFIVIV
jgi:hypothetical protein